MQILCCLPLWACVFRFPGAKHALIMDRDVVLVPTQIDSLTQMAKDLDLPERISFSLMKAGMSMTPKPMAACCLSMASDYSRQIFEEQFMSVQEGCINDQIYLNRMFEGRKHNTPSS